VRHPNYRGMKAMFLKKLQMPSELEKAQKPKKDMDLLHTRTGGAYIPPAKLKMMQEQISDKNSEVYQRLNWERLKKRIHGQVNKANTSNLLNVIRDLLQENVIRGRGLLARSIIQAQSYSPTFSNVYAALVAVINSHFPNIGMLIVHRLLIQFKRCYKRNDKTSTVTISKFIAHLINQQVIHEILALEMMILMLENPTDDSVEITVAFLKECGAKLSEISPRGLNAIFDRLRSILSDSDIDKRIQYMIEVIFHIRKDKFQAYPALIDDLDLIEEDDQITHTITLEDLLLPENELNVFKYDPEFEKHEKEYEEIRRDAIGLAEESSDEEEGEETPDEEITENREGEKQSTMIIDNTEQNLVAFRRNIYLTIQSSLDFQEAAHKLLKIDLKSGQDVELCNMIVDCCAQQRTYEKFYGLLAERFCRLRKEFQEAFERIARDTYSTIHRFEYNKLRNMACLVAHLLSTDAISWDILDQISLNEEDTTSSGRIYIKIVFQELAEFLGVENLLQRIRDPTMQSSFDKIFPRDNPNNTRFSINFFTTIGLGYLTVDLRLHLDQARKKARAKEDSLSSESSLSDSDSDESSSDSTSSTSSSETDDGDNNEEPKRNIKASQKGEQIKKAPKIVKKENYSLKDTGRKNECDWKNKSHDRVSKVAERHGNDRKEMKRRSYDKESDRKMEKKYEENRKDNKVDEQNVKKHKKSTIGREDNEERRNERKKHDRTEYKENKMEERKRNEKQKRRRRDSNDTESREKHTNNEESDQDDRDGRTNKSKQEQHGDKRVVTALNKRESKRRRHD
ncbi:unnamed protein product, partial [Onchocerca ochengi]